MSSYVIAYGNLADGFTIVGPFASQDDAIVYADTDGRGPQEWNILELFAPASSEEG